MGIIIRIAIRKIYGIIESRFVNPDLPRGYPIPIVTGPESALTNPTTIEPTNAPGTDPMVPNTMIANDGRRSVNAVSGLNLRVSANTAPPIPDRPAERKALTMWTLSTLIPLLAASSSLSATALILLPSLVLFRRRINRSTALKMTNGTTPL